MISNLPMEDLIQVADAAAIDAQVSELHGKSWDWSEWATIPTQRTCGRPCSNESGIELVEVRLRRLHCPRQCVQPLRNGFVPKHSGR